MLMSLISVDHDQPNDHPSADVVPAMFQKHQGLNADGRGYPLFMGVWLMMLMLMIIHDYSNI